MDLAFKRWLRVLCSIVFDDNVERRYTTRMLKIIDAELLIGNEGFTPRRGTAQVKTQGLY